MTIKQVIVMRTDLGMRRGKQIAQGSHASMAWMSPLLLRAFEKMNAPHLTDAQFAWLSGLFTKICVRVKSEEGLLTIRSAAVQAGLEVHLITDAGLTEFGGRPTMTCLAIGPDEAEKIDAITGKLELL